MNHNKFNPLTALRCWLGFLVLSVSCWCFAQESSDTQQPYIWAKDFPIGATLPQLTALNSQGEPVTLNSLAGDKGLLVLFNRSAVW